MADQLITGTTLVESTSRSNGDVPVGGILPWLKNFIGASNITAGWVECNGQTLNDPLSSMNGQVIPDLNGDNRFLRGNSTSGDTGGSSSSSVPSHTHNLPFMISSAGEEIYLQSGQGITTTGGADRYELEAHNYDLKRKTSSSTHSTNDRYMKTASSSATTVDTIPPYYNVVWIMRTR